MTKNEMATHIESLENSLEASRETSSRLSVTCAALQRDMADRDAEISRLRAAIEKGAKEAEWHHRRLADRDTLIADLRSDLEKSSTARASDCIELVARREQCEKLDIVTDNQTREIIGLNNQVVNLRRELEQITIDRDGWVAAARAEQKKKITARDQRDEEAKARQRVQINLDKATARIAELEAAVAAPGCRPVALFHAEQRLSEKEGECRALRDRVAHQEIKIVNLRGELVEVTATADRLRDQLTESNGERDKSSTAAQHWWTMHQEALVDLDSLRKELAQLNESTAPAPALEVAACHCDDLQEALANLHKAGSAHLKYQLSLNTALVTFIQAHTRAGDLLEEINSL